MKLVPDTLAARISVWYAAIFLLFFGVAFVSFYLVVDYTLGKSIDEDLAEDIAEFRILMDTQGIRRVEMEIEREAASSQSKEIFLRLVDASGTQTFGSDSSHWPGLDRLSLEHELVSAEREPVFATLFGQDDDHATRVVSAPIAADLWLQIGESMESRAEFMELILNLFPFTFVLVALLAALVGWIIAKQALRGVEEVSRAAEAVANGRLESRVSVGNRGAEIERLAATFNLMIDRIRSLISGMRDMTDNIAHDLRSPLARIRANSESALLDAKTVEEYDSSAADTLEECDRLLEMINTTLDVAEAEVGAHRFETDEVDVSDMVKDVCELFSPLAEDKQIRLLTEMVTGCRVRGNRKHLQRMLANLVDNALKYTPANGTVGVVMSAHERAVSISVRDTGVGIPVSEKAHIFERFFRCDQSRSQPGFGLGLSLARAVARAHGGNLVVESTLGSGSVFTVTLPRYAQEFVAA